MQFTKPVTILVGLGFPSTIGSAARAYAVLADWPPSQRGPEYEVALSKCRAALTGEVDGELARLAFADFARSAGILTSERSQLQTAAASGKAGGHRAPR
ncbi:DUF982 domain-containing protein [Arvimicrobium flavum]|uniref:DUF982 domain-containing protein n=1 Tax=Arvimicrobium flavum TaxID=3393320 RepID=UPI00237A6F34|nr:DUF982 domain-containing protein [Mesorhizobium shangrilense]